MKKITLSLLFFVSIFCASFFTSDNRSLASGTMTELSINYVATGTIKGYSYPSKMKVYIDGELVGESGVKDQQKKNKFKVNVPTGSHSIKCQVWALYKGDWQERTVANDYSFDWAYSGNMTFGSKNKLTIIFDIKNSKVVAH